MTRKSKAEMVLASECPLMVSLYVKWFGSSSEDWPGISESRKQILLLVYRLCTPAHVGFSVPDQIDESLWVCEIPVIRY